MATILALYVAGDYRGRGVGTRLVQDLEGALAGAGREIAVFTHAVSSDGASPLKPFFEACARPTSGRRLHYFTLDGRIMSCAWFDRAVLPAPFVIGAWNSVTAAERRALDPSHPDGAWVPKLLIPSDYDARFDPMNSLVLQAPPRHHRRMADRGAPRARPREIREHLRDAITQPGRPHVCDARAHR